MTSFVGPDAVAEGRACADMILDFYADSDKETIHVLEVQHTPGLSVTLDRGNGFAEGIEGTNIEILDSQTAEGSAEKAMQITESWLLKYGPGEIDAIYIQGDGMLAGVVNAVVAADRVGEFPIVGIAMSAATYDMISAGEAYGSVIQSPHTQAKNTIETAYKICSGEEVPQFNYEPIEVVTQENVATAQRPDW